MSIFTIPLSNGQSMILIVTMWSKMVALVFVTFVALAGLFMTGKTVLDGKIKKSHGLLCFENDRKNLY